MKDRELTLIAADAPGGGLEAAMLAYAPLVKAVLPHPAAVPATGRICMADVFVSLWRNAAKLDHYQTPLRPWLAVAARNRAIDCYNALRRRETVTLTTAWPRRSASWLSGPRHRRSRRPHRCAGGAFRVAARPIFFCANIICSTGSELPLRWV